MLRALQIILLICFFAILVDYFMDVKKTTKVN